MKTARAMTPDTWIDGHARFAPDHPALEFEGRTETYRALAYRIARVAGGLLTIGVGEGDRVAYLGFNRPEAIHLQLACARVGAIYMPLNWRLTADEIGWIVGNGEPRAIFCDPAHVDLLKRIETPPGTYLASFEPVDGFLTDLDALAGIAEPVPHKPRPPETPLQLVYTSGTTGRPKGAILSHASVAATARMGRHMYGLTRHDRVLNVLPLFHVGGMNIHSLTALSGGATLVLHEKVDPKAIAHAFLDGGITLTNVVPTILEAVMAQPDWPAAAKASLRTISIGSTDVPPALSQAVLDAGLPLLQIYGCTETGPTAIYQTAALMPGTLGAMGRAGIACEVRIAREDGSEAATGEDGEIWVRGPNCMTGYWRNDDATAATLTDGWVHTGDVARVDADGTYWFADRIKHVIISGGENIYPAELQRVLAGDPVLAEFTVVGVPDPKWGAVPVVLAVAKGDVTEAEVLARFDGKIARFKRPKAALFVDKLPRNAMGKIVLAEAEAMAREAMAAR